MHSKVNIDLFGDQKPVNRRMTPQERAEEIMIANIFKRHPRDFILDTPFYPYCPPVPKYSVNFDLNAPQ